jgi:ribosome modulation factor
MQMNSFRRFTIAGTVFLLLSSSPGIFAQYAPPPAGYGGQGGWDAPPGEYSDAARRGFQDGLEGARKDYENHRTPNVNNRDEYRHPNVPKPMRRDYRMGFQRGYDAGVRHMMGEGRR